MCRNKVVMTFRYRPESWIVNENVTNLIKWAKVFFPSQLTIKYE